MIFSKKAPAVEWLVAGLGNPGMQYEGTRHNAGFAAADRIAEKCGAAFEKHKFDAVWSLCELGGKRILLAKPQTFMNNSGRAVLQLSSFYKIPADRIIIMYDDISLPVGGLRVRTHGSHGGHNGMRDITEVMGTEKIMRVRIGVGQKPRPDYDLADWVLGRLPEEQLDDFNRAVERAGEAVEEIICRGAERAMNKYNRL